MLNALVIEVIAACVAALTIYVCFAFTWWVLAALAAICAAVLAFIAYCEFTKLGTEYSSKPVADVVDFGTSWFNRASKVFA